MRPEGHGFWSIVKRRSSSVGVSPCLHHVVPAGMFEAPNIDDAWSIKMNIWREILEEVYDERNLIGRGIAWLPDHILRMSPIDVLQGLLKNGEAELSVTGIFCDLLSLRTEICTILFVKNADFATARRMELNWEYESAGPAGSFGFTWNAVDQLIDQLSTQGSVAVGGAVCLSLGRKWVQSRYAM